jgi:dCTP deaminase
MMLSDTDLTDALQGGAVRIGGLHPDAVQPASVDLRLGPEFRVFIEHRYAVIDPEQEQPGLTESVDVRANLDSTVWGHVRDGAYLLQPGEFVLATTAERVQLDEAHAARIEGKSSLGRLGLMVHSTAGFVDPGFAGQVTLELSNVSPLPIVLRPGMWIAQLCVFELLSPATRPYGPARGSRYQNQYGPTASLAWRNPGNRPLYSGV